MKHTLRLMPSRLSKTIIMWEDQNLEKDGGEFLKQFQAEMKNQVAFLNDTD